MDGYVEDCLFGLYVEGGGEARVRKSIFILFLKYFPMVKVTITTILPLETNGQSIDRSVSSLALNSWYWPAMLRSGSHYYIM